MRIACIIVTLCVVGGCATTVEGFRTGNRRAYTMKVPYKWEEVHTRIVATLHDSPYNNEMRLHEEAVREQGRGVIWPYEVSMRGPRCFVIDTERVEDTLTKVTVYPESRFQGQKARELIERAVADLKQPEKPQ